MAWSGSGRKILAQDGSQLMAALAVIAADDYHVWIKVGMALKMPLGDEGLETWRKWSATATSVFDPEAIEPKPGVVQRAYKTCRPRDDLPPSRRIQQQLATGVRRGASESRVRSDCQRGRGRGHPTGIST